MIRVPFLIPAAGWTVTPRNERRKAKKDVIASLGKGALCLFIIFKRSFLRVGGRQWRRYCDSVSLHFPFSYFFFSFVSFVAQFRVHGRRRVSRRGFLVEFLQQMEVVTVIFLSTKSLSD